MKKYLIATVVFTMILAMTGCNASKSKKDGIVSNKPKNVDITGIVTTSVTTENIKENYTTQIEQSVGLSEIKGKGTYIISTNVISLSPQRDIDEIITNCIDYYDLPSEYSKIQYNNEAYALDFGYIEKYDGRVVIDVLVQGVNLNVFEKDFKLPTEK